MFILRTFVLSLFVFLTGMCLSASGSIAFLIIFLIPMSWLYMLPTIEAHSLKHPNLSSITILNIFLGWTLLGWVAAAVWAFKKPELVKMTSETAQEQASVAEHQDIKICPYCAEEIKLKAVVCKHCGKDLPA